MKYSRKGIYNSQNHITLQKVKNMKHFVSQTSTLAPKMVVPLTSPGRIVVLSWTKYAVRRQINSGIFQLIIRREQSDYSIVFIFVSFEEKGYCYVVSVGQLIFDCRSYCVLSCRVQGKTSLKINLTSSGGRRFDSHRGQNKFFFTSCGSLIPFTRANAQWVFHGFHIAL